MDIDTTRAVGDGGSPHASEKDPNGARTAVGVPHPENRLGGQSVPAVDLSHFELDDYDDDRQDDLGANQIPSGEDSGESFSNIVDVGEGADGDARGVIRGSDQDKDLDAADRPDDLTPTVDNQLNQPGRFHNHSAKS